MEWCRDPDCDHRFHGHKKAKTFRLTFKAGKIKFSGEYTVSVSIQAGFSVGAVASHPILSDGTPSSAVLTNLSLSTSDVNVFTVTPDTTNAGGWIIVSVNPGSATVTGTATATETDGTVHQIPLTPDTVTVTPAPPPPTPPAVAFGLVYGTPFQTPTAPPPPATT